MVAFGSGIKTGLVNRLLFDRSVSHKDMSAQSSRLQTVLGRLRTTTVLILLVEVG